MQKGLENAQKGEAADQDILLVLAREALGSYKPAIVIELESPRIDPDGYEARIQAMPNRGFIAMNIAIVLLVRPSVTDSSAQLRDILKLPHLMERMVGGDLTRFIHNLKRAVDEFETIHGFLTSDLLVRMLVMETILLSKHHIIASWRSYRMKESK